ncbi:distal tail protein Dit [Paraclostridium tenue]|uniref:Phage tail family protein n=1 Tax=Paraclostridium tenue TaxID=1737 RepID=A0ABP3XLL9_9FIRM
MFNKYYLIFNDLNSYEDFGLSIVKRPDIPNPTLKKTTKEVPGRDGLLYEVLGGYEDIVISVEFNFIEKINIKERFRQVKAWISGIQNDKLIFSDDLDWFYKVVDVKLNGNFETILRMKGSFKIDFTCRAFMYSIDGDEFEEIYNNYQIVNYYMESKPIIRIHGLGMIDININNKKFKVDVNEEVYIDSELELAYKTVDDPFNLIEGDFPVFEKGMNKINYSGNVFKFEIKPRWRCL